MLVVRSKVRAKPRGRLQTATVDFVAVMRIVVASVVVLALSSTSTLALAPGGDAVGKLLRPRHINVETYAETWTVIADLPDGTYIQAQFAVTNAGPGSRKGACRLLVTRPGKAAFTRAATLSRDKWHHRGRTLTMGTCRATVDGTGMDLWIRLKGARVHLRLNAMPHATIPPGGQLRHGGDFYTSTILVAWADAVVDLKLPGAPLRRGLRGRGFADHSRSTAMPAKLATRWVRYRQLRGNTPVIALLRFPPGKSTAKGWIWRKGTPRPVVMRGATLRRVGKGWMLRLPGEKAPIRTRRQLYRYAPVEEMGFLGTLVGAIVGNAVTYTYRTTKGLLEISEVDE